MDIKEFLENKSIRETIIKKQAYSFETKLFKVNFDRFDYVYVIDFVENKKPRMCDKAEFGGIIDTETNKILQCYAEHNTKPQQEVQEFINKKWLPYSNKKLKAMVVA